MMEQRISLITLGVTDLERSLRFYRDGLGWPTSWDGSKGVVFFGLRGTCLSLYPCDDLDKDIGLELKSQAATRQGLRPGVTLAHNVREKAQVDEVMALAERAAARIVKPAQDTFWGGYSGYFADPDGYLWEVAWGAFEMRDDGSLIIP